MTPTAIYDLEAQLDSYAVLDPDDIDKANEILYKPKVTSKDKQKLTFYFHKTENLIKQYEPVKQAEIVAAMRHFVRFYEFLLQASFFSDVELHKKYNFATYVLAYINIKHPGGGYNLDGKIKATNFVQKKSEEHVKSDLVAKPVVKLPTADNFSLTEAKEERLSQIIAEINSRTGKSYDNDVAVKAMLQIRDIMLKSEKLKISAKIIARRILNFRILIISMTRSLRDWIRIRISFHCCLETMRLSARYLEYLLKKYTEVCAIHKGVGFY